MGMSFTRIAGPRQAWNHVSICVKRAGTNRTMDNTPLDTNECINMLTVRFCQPLFSAALIAIVESHVEDDAARNALCAVVHSPEVPRDWTNGPAGIARGVSPEDRTRMALLQPTGAKAGKADARLPALLAMPT